MTGFSTLLYSFAAGEKPDRYRCALCAKVVRKGFAANAHGRRHVRAGEAIEVKPRSQSRFGPVFVVPAAVKP